METISRLLNMALEGALIANGRYTPAYVSWPIACLCFLLFGFVFGGLLVWLSSLLSMAGLASIAIAVAALIAIGPYAIRKNLGFPISKPLVLAYFFSLLIGATSIIYAAP